MTDKTYKDRQWPSPLFVTHFCYSRGGDKRSEDAKNYIIVHLFLNISINIENLKYVNCAIKYKPISVVNQIREDI